MPIRPKNRAVETPVVEPVALPEPAPMVSTVSQDQGVLMVRRCNYSNGLLTAENIDEQRIPTPKFEGEVARTRVSLGITKSLGGFEFARIDIMVEMPCNPNADDLRETNEFASEQATEFLNREIVSLAPIDRGPPPVTNMSALTHG